MSIIERIFGKRSARLSPWHYFTDEQLKKMHREWSVNSIQYPYSYKNERKQLPALERELRKRGAI